MISVIVPVYNVEPYLEKCLNSTLAQTYKKLGVLLVDDGSTDGSSEICDKYAGKDVRVRVFHTENSGVSDARNLGLDNANGEYVGFVDSDDWIEPDMYETLFTKAQETNADVAECGAFWESVSTTRENRGFAGTVEGSDSVEAYNKGAIWLTLWNKIFRRTLFENVRFPSGRVYEDIAATHKLVANARVTGVGRPLCHHRQRNGSITHNYDLKNLVDFWLAHKDRYEYLKGYMSEERVGDLLREYAYAIGRIWTWYLKCEKSPEFIEEVSSFVHENYPTLGFKGWPLNLRTRVFWQDSTIVFPLR